MLANLFEGLGVLCEQRGNYVSVLFGLLLESIVEIFSLLAGGGFVLFVEALVDDGEVLGEEATKRILV